MESQRRSELLDKLRNKFDDYIDYYDLMECLPGLTETKVKSLIDKRTRNGLQDFSFWTTSKKGTLLVSASKFEQWVANNFKPLLDDSECAPPDASDPI